MFFYSSKFVKSSLVFGSLYSFFKGYNKQELRVKSPLYRSHAFNLNFKEFIWGKQITYPDWDDDWDKRKELDKSADKDEMMCTRTLLFIRHGDYYKEGPKKGHLNQEGTDQSHWAGKRLNELMKNDLVINRFIISTMPRAKETYQLMAKHFSAHHKIDKVFTDTVTEGYPCVPDPKAGIKRPSHVLFQDSTRLESAFRKLFYRPQSSDESTYEVVVCHANLIRYFVMRALQLPKQAWLRFELHNASFTEITISNTGLVGVMNVGEHFHVKQLEESTVDDELVDIGN